MDANLKATLEAIAHKGETKKPPQDTIRVNEHVGQAAFFYEKLRNAIDYQDESLFLKNAIKRIIKRRSLLGTTEIGRQLLHELVWARYFTNEDLPTTHIDHINKILKKYQILRSHIRSRSSGTTIATILRSFAACEIEQFLSPPVAKLQYLNFVQSQILKNIEIPATEVDPTALQMQVRVSAEKLLFKADLDQVRFDMMRYYYPKWPNLSESDLKDFGQKFDHVISGIDWQINQTKSGKIAKYVKKCLPPFLVLWEIIYKNPNGAKTVIEDKEKLNYAAQGLISQKNAETIHKVRRSLLRGIIFILMTKVVLAFLIELPYETQVMGQINYSAIITNTALPAMIMLITGIFISVPGKKNSRALLKMIEEIVFADTLNVKKITSLKAAHSRGYVLFNSLYSIVSLIIIALTVYLLVSLGFNVISIILFFLFVSVVSFLAFRIRATAKELEVKAADDTVLTGVLNFFLLPFVIVGKFLSEKWSEYNFTLLFWDFIIEAPLKSIIGVSEAWLAYSREKREDFE